ncbi:targeting protein for Xklp2-B-like isoform X2 [Rhincodon typus]|uniref:targeting protein for Xklp2-B-like isoform X2 n=1 Tax=Rhincodon typus TaxID=259920 RepID=UPI00202F586F|nr:targeting protein for Xklp2-B-like isoform X2 [Rhincodon typus]
MERSAKVTLPTAHWKHGVPKATVCPMTYQESFVSDLDESSGEIQTSSPDISQSAHQSSVVNDNPTFPLVAVTEPQLTVLAIPNILKWHSLLPKPMSTEELTMATITRLQKETAEHIKRNRRMMHRAIAGAGQQCRQRNNLPSTRPINIQQNASTLARTRKPKLDPEYREFNFVQELRKYPPSTYSIQGCTVPKPFQLSEKWSQRNEAENEPYVPMAEFINRLEYRTGGCCKLLKHQGAPGTTSLLSLHLYPSRNLLLCKETTF